MVLSPPTTERYVIGANFFSTLVRKVEGLEADAAQDEIFAVTLDDPDHKRRHLQLVESQREDAAMLREFLAVVKIRPAA
jgi:hypothetical protein